MASPNEKRHGFVVQCTKCAFKTTVGGKPSQVNYNALLAQVKTAHRQEHNTGIIIDYIDIPEVDQAHIDFDVVLKDPTSTPTEIDEAQLELKATIEEIRNRSKPPFTNDDFIITESFHATEIDHSFVEQLVAQDQTLDNTWSDIPGAVIPSTNFTVGKKYLLIMTGNLTTTNDAQDLGMRTVHNATPFDASEKVVDIQGTTNRYAQYFWSTVWTAVDGEDIKLQQKVFGTTTIRSDQMTLIAINLSDDLVEGVDWFFDSDATDTALLSTWSTLNNASITFTPAEASDWLVISSSRMTTDNNAYRPMSRINRTGEATSTQPQSDQPISRVPNTMINHTLCRVFSLGIASNTFQEQSQANFSGGVRTRFDSSMFALNLNLFSAHSFAFTEAQSDFITTLYGTEFQTDTIIPNVTGDVLTMGWALHGTDVSTGGSSDNMRMQMDDADLPAGQTGGAAPNFGESYAATDRIPVTWNTIENLSNASHTADLDGSTFSTNGGHATNRLILNLTMELLAGPAEDFGQILNSSCMI